MKRVYAAAAAAGMMMVMTFGVEAREIEFTGQNCPLTVYSSVVDGTVIEGLDEVSVDAGVESVVEEAADSGVESVVENVVDSAVDSNVESVAEVVEEAADGGQAGIHSLDVFGRVNEEYAAVRVKGVYGYVSVAELTEKVPMLDLNALPDASWWTIVQRGDHSDDVKMIQEQLIAKGYLDGAADGAYGNGTAAAVEKFQTEMGLDVTGACDLMTRLVLADAGEEKLVLEYPPVFHVEDKFSAILDLTSADLEPYASPKWKFDYDVFTGIGTIDSGVPLGSVGDDSTDAARIEMNAKMIVFVQRNEAGAVDVVPAICVESTGSHRPYLNAVIVRCGDSVAEMKKSFSTGAIDGTTLSEMSIFPITTQAAELMAKAGETGMTLRLQGQNKVFDLECGAQAGAIGEFLAGAGV